MPDWREWVEWRIVPAQAVRVGDVTVRPLVRSLVVRPPWGSRTRGGSWSYRWSRPAGVIVTEGGVSRHIPIVDVTRVAQIALLVGSALAVRRLFGRR